MPIPKRNPFLKGSTTNKREVTSFSTYKPIDKANVAKLKEMAKLQRKDFSFMILQCISQYINNSK